MSPFFPRVSPGEIADVMGNVVAYGRDLVDHLVDPLLEVPALRGSSRLLRLDLLLRAEALAQRGQLGRQRLDPLAVLRVLVQLLLLRALHRADHRLLEVGERIGSVLGGELLGELGSLMLHRRDQHLADLLLHRAGPLAVEAVGESLNELLLALFDHPAEPVGEGPQLALELGPDVVHIGGGPLGLDQARADLDRPRDGFGRRAVLVGLLSHDAGRPGVLHLEALDHQAVVDRPDRAARSPGSSGSCGFLDASIGPIERSRGDGREPDER